MLRDNSRRREYPHDVADDALIAMLVRALAPRHEVVEAYLFGSRARGDASLHSDVDVAVYLASRHLFSSLEVTLELTAELMQALQRNDIEVIVLNRAPPLLYHRVLRDGVRLLSRDLQATTTREGQALSRYCDYLPQLRKIDRVLQARTLHRPGAR